MFLCLYYRYIAREEEQKEVPNKEPISSDTATTSETAATRGDERANNDNTETENISYYSSFPLLPLPPQEYCYHTHEAQHWTVPTEDKMGTLHNAIINTKPKPKPRASSSQTSLDRGTEHRMTSNQSGSVRFVPRTQHLENRKRKMEEAAHLLSDFERNSEPLIGPKLPEPPKLDMEDESLNTTVSLIRNTLKKVACNLILS